MKGDAKATVIAASENPADTCVRDQPNSAESGFTNRLKVKMKTDAKLAKTPKNAATRIVQGVRTVCKHTECLQGWQ